MRPAIHDHARPAEATGIESAAATAVGLLTALAVIGVAPFSAVPMDAHPQVSAVYGVSALLASVAVMVLARRWLPAGPATTLLLATCAYDIGMSVAHVLLFPGAVAGNASVVPAKLDTVGWFYIAWKLGLSLLMALALLVPRRGRSTQHRARWPLLAALVPLPLYAAVETWSLPHYFTGPGGQSFGELADVSTWVAAAILGFALVLMWVTERTRHRLELWLALLMAANAAGLAISTIGGGRYTVGWYASRAIPVLVTATFLVVTALALRADRGRPSLHASDSRT